MSYGDIRMTIFAKVFENECINERHPLVKEFDQCCTIKRCEVYVSFIH